MKMAKRQKAQRIIGLVLLVVLAIPVVVLSIPATYTDVIWHESGGIPNIITPEYVTVTYTPLIELLRTVDGTPDDVSVLAIYVGLFVLAVWLVVHSTKHRRTQ
jgi:hypothetical protein